MRCCQLFVSEQFVRHTVVPKCTNILRAQACSLIRVAVILWTRLLVRRLLKRVGFVVHFQTSVPFITVRVFVNHNIFLNSATSSSAVFSTVKLTEPIVPNFLKLVLLVHVVPVCQYTVHLY